jgi:hypothetical protein
MLTRLLTLAFSALLATSALAHDGPGHHEASGYLDQRDLPSCDAGRVIHRIIEKAAYADARQWHTGIVVERVDRPRQRRHIGSAGTGLRERRWCEARAHMSDGRTRQVYYLIEGYAGFAGIRYGVESCIAGRDFWNVYGGNCRAIRVW